MAREQIIEILETQLKDIADFMWGWVENDEYDVAIGYNDNGYPNSVSLIIHGRTHSDFKFTNEILALTQQDEPTTEEIREWYDATINPDCSPSSAIYLFHEWLRDRKQNVRPSVSEEGLYKAWRAGVNHGYFNQDEELCRKEHGYFTFEEWMEQYKTEK
jgi:hypothetical protein